MAKIVSYRLASSEWVIGELVETLESNSGYVTLRRPRAIHIVPQNKETYVPMLIPLDPITPDGDIRVFERAIAVEQLNINQQMVDKYLAETSSIEIVSSLADLGNFR